MKNKNLLVVVAGLIVVLSCVYVWYFKVRHTSTTMRVVTSVPFNMGQYSRDPSLMKIGQDNIKVSLKGPVEVTGNYFFEATESGFSGYCMKDFDVSFLGTLPYSISPEKVKIFCFRNEDAANQKLGKDSKKITVTIDNFELNSYSAEVMNWADLIDVKF